ncbi:hypothetical protein ANN_03036 [Periplaneta americana]|uniref:Uncharacterized protein n=1 Tax=Periplaneta americana TaxID=6978 RepID=A0ABQ8TZK7_PERAM|nr:hypothetical protein ANN_03036 [Periplaneta americana]
MLITKIHIIIAVEQFRAVASWSKASCLGLALRNARWFESSRGKKFSHEISASVWDRCSPSIVMHLWSNDRERSNETVVPLYRYALMLSPFPRKLKFLNTGFIIDPTVRFETNEEQPAEVDKEKKNIYDPTTPYYLQKYQLEELEVIDFWLEQERSRRMGSILADLNPLEFAFWDVESRVYSFKIRGLHVPNNFEINNHSACHFTETQTLVAIFRNVIVRDE